MDERETLGKFLKREREKKNLSLKDLAAGTRVKERLLKAIEDDRYELLPSPIYIKGFLSAFAKALDLDPKEILLRYEHECSFKRESMVVPSKNQFREGPLKRFVQHRRQIGLVLGVTGISLLLSYYFHPFLSGPSKAVLPDKPGIREMIPPASAVQPSAVTPSPEKKPFSVVLKAVEETWVQVQVDGQSKVEALFKPGEQNSFQALDRMELWIGNAGGIDLFLNESRLDRFGKSGEVVKLVITPQGVVRKGREEGRPVRGE